MNCQNHFIKGCFGSAKTVFGLLSILTMLVACSESVEQPRTPQPIKLSVPGGTPLLRAVDASSIQATLEWSSSNSPGVLLSQNMTRVGTTEQWESQPVEVTAGATYEFRLLWSAIGIEGVRVNYAQQNFTHESTTANVVLNISGNAYQFDLFNDDGGAANNFEELLAGTPPTGPPEPINENSQAIEGLWDITANGNIRYLEFTADAKWIIWDYDADLVGGGLNCYRKTEADFIPIGNNNFNLTGEVVTVVVDGDKATVSNSAGTFTYPRAVGVSVVDFALC